FQPAQFFRVVDASHALEKKNGLAEMNAAGNHTRFARRGVSVASSEPHFFPRREARGKIGENFGGDFAAPAPWAQNSRQSQRCRQFVRHYSRISRVYRFRNFIPAAPRMVRIDLAVRPCRPMTLPRSSGWTRNSKTVTCSPSTART